MTSGVHIIAPIWKISICGSMKSVLLFRIPVMKAYGYIEQSVISFRGREQRFLSFFIAEIPSARS